MKIIYLILERITATRYRETWSEHPRTSDFILLSKEVQTLGEIQEGLKMLEKKNKDEAKPQEIK